MLSYKLHKQIVRNNAVPPNSPGAPSSGTRLIHISSRLQFDTNGENRVELKVWKNTTFQEIVNYAARMHTIDNVPFREAMHYYVDAMLDVEFCEVYLKDLQEGNVQPTNMDDVSEIKNPQ
jgi:hypothetical protein